MAVDEPTFESSYFEETEPYVSDSDATYTDARRPISSARTYEWNHGIGEIVTAVLRQGLELQSLAEHDWTRWPRFPWLVQTGDGRWVVPPGRPRIPLSFTLMARESVSTRSRPGPGFGAGS